MARTKFDETDRLIIERWADVAALLEATDGLKRKISDFVDDSQDRFEDWAKPRGFEADVHGRDGEVHIFKLHWTKRDDVKMALVFGGLTAKCILELDQSKAFASVWAPGLKSLGIDRAGRERLREELKRNLGAEFTSWDQDTDDEWLLNKYLEIDGETMRRALLGRDAFVDFVTAQLERLIPLAEVLDAAIQTVRGGADGQAG